MTKHEYFAIELNRCAMLSGLQRSVEVLDGYGKTKTTGVAMRKEMSVKEALEEAARFINQSNDEEMIKAKDAIIAKLDELEADLVDDLISRYSSDPTLDRSTFGKAVEIGQGQLYYLAYEQLIILMQPCANKMAC